MITTTECNCWKRCKMMHWWKFGAGAHGCGIRARICPKLLKGGRFVHWAQAVYATGGAMKDVTAVDQWPDYPPAPDRDEGLQNHLFKALAACYGYADHYPEEPKLEWLEVEEPFEFIRDGITVKGKLDGLYREEGLLILRERKYSSIAAAPPLTSIQGPLYCLSVLDKYKQYPDYIEYDITVPSKLKHRVSGRGGKESLDEYFERVRQQYAPADSDHLCRVRVPVIPTTVDLLWARAVMPVAVSIAATIPYMESVSCFAYGKACAYLPLCEDLLKGGSGLEDPKLAVLYVHKDVKYPELEEEEDANK